MRTLRHRIAHAIGWHTGHVETFWALFRQGDDKRLMVGFRCDHCGDIDHVHEAPSSMQAGATFGRGAIDQRAEPLASRRAEGMRNSAGDVGTDAMRRRLHDRRTP